MWLVDLQNRSTGWGWARAENKVEKERSTIRNQNVTSHVFAQIAHVVEVPRVFAVMTIHAKSTWHCDNVRVWLYRRRS